MSLYAELPSALRGNALEARERFPIVWVAQDAATASYVGQRVHDIIEVGHLAEVFTVRIRENTVTVNRSDIHHD